MEMGKEGERKREKREKIEKEREGERKCFSNQIPPFVLEKQGFEASGPL
jgi:hypothetical protein